jgi:CheY-like chemotaxis protein
MLKEALDKAEYANRAKTSFLSNMSHEIRTPMNAIIGLDNIALKDPDLTPNIKEKLEKIGASARHLLDIINDILDMSRIESGRIKLRKEEFSFRAMLEQINTMVMSQCSDKGLAYECRLLSRVDDYYIGDDVRLKEVLINILSNAIKFTEAPGNVIMTVERTAVFGDQSTLHFCIKDTGIGMDKEYIPKIFDPFSQEDSTTKSKYGSTGLGMAITKRIVEMMNGTISVESEKGVGSTFTVVMTLKNTDHQVRDTEDSVDPGRMRVLVVDDDEIAAEHARKVLDEVGIRANVCLSGTEALRMLEVQYTKHEPYNLVLMDWKMPEMDGLEAAKEIRKLYNNETTVVIITAYNWDDIEEEAHRIGVDSFLSKPLFASNVIEEFARIALRNNMSLFKEKKRVSLEGRKILIAEDQEMNAEILIDVLELEDMEADHAENGLVVVNMFRDSDLDYYDAILMDVRMPEMDGLEATAAIRNLDRPDAKRIPIIALTANAFDEDVQRSLQAGMNAHLTKPVDPDHLYQTLGELIYEAEEKSEIEKSAREQ